MEMGAVKMQIILKGESLPIWILKQGFSKLLFSFVSEMRIYVLADMFYF